ncbi:MAG: hypothetical protein V4654_03055 [Bdellovibrionota bacterium]
MQLKTILKSTKGYSIIEALIAGGIIAVVTGGLGIAINQGIKTRNKIQIVANAVALEAAITSALQDPTSYNGFANILSSQNISQFRSEFRLNVPDWGNIPIQTGSTTSFTNQRQVCNDFDTNKDCTMRVRIDAQETSTSPLRYAFAYRIEINPLVAAMPALGKAAGGNFEAADYIIPVPNSAHNASIACDSLTPLAATGYNSSTGQMTCLEGPTTSCASGSIAVGLQISIGSNNLNFVCQPLAQLSCSSDLYAINRFSPQNMMNIGQAESTSQCGFIGATTVNSFTGPVGLANAVDRPILGNSGRSTAGAGNAWRHGVGAADGTQWATLCPSGYVANITQCTAVLADTLEGLQPSRCPVGYPGDCLANTNAAWPVGVWYGPAATYGGSPVAPINVGTTLSGTSGNRAYCILNNQSQPPGAGWSGYVEMAVTCTVDTIIHPPTATPTATF